MTEFVLALAAAVVGGVVAWRVWSGKKSRHRIRTDFFEAVRLAMLRVMLVDGSVGEAELETAANIFRQVTGEIVSPEQIRADADVVLSGSRRLEDALGDVGPHLNVNGRGVVVQAALLVALADGNFGPGEQELLQDMSRAIGLTDEEFRAAIGEVMQAHDDAVAAAERAQRED